MEGDGGEEEETNEHLVPSTSKENGIPGATAKKVVGAEWEKCFNQHAILVPDVNNLTLTFRHGEKILLTLLVAKVQDNDRLDKPFIIYGHELNEDAPPSTKVNTYKVKVEEGSMFGLVDALGKMKNKIAANKKEGKINCSTIWIDLIIVLVHLTNFSTFVLIHRLKVNQSAFDVLD